jgi:hypothetical protein
MSYGRCHKGPASKHATPAQSLRVSGEARRHPSERQFMAVATAALLYLARGAQRLIEA